MEGDNTERRRRANELRDKEKAPSAAGVTTGASKQHRRGDDPSWGKRAGEDDEAPDTRPGSSLGRGRN